MHNNSMNILQEIFKDNYEIIQYTLHPRDVEMENIEKMINCGAPSFGGAIMTDGDLLDMHYFLTEDDDLGDASEEGFYIF